MLPVIVTKLVIIPHRDGTQKYAKKNIYLVAIAFTFNRQVLGTLKNEVDAIIKLEIGIHPSKPPY